MVYFLHNPPNPACYAGVTEENFSVSALVLLYFQRKLIDWVAIGFARTFDDPELDKNNIFTGRKFAGIQRKVKVRTGQRLTVMVRH